VYSIYNILHCFTKDAVIHQLKEVYMKVVFRLRSQLGVKIDIFFQLRAVFLLNNLVNFFVIFKPGRSYWFDFS